MKKLSLTISFFFLLTISIVRAQTNPDALIPLNPNVKTGQLPNGMTYYVMQNKKPEHRAELRLVVNVGSTQENDDQQGLAHLTEHMAFNGTKHFAKHELVDYLQSIGAKFGADLNAYTSYDETVYMIKIPTDSAEIIDKAFLILEDWAHNLSMDSDEIDKERGVVIEEWRLGLVAEKRMRSKYEPLLFQDSRYAIRNPIGKKEILENCTYETLRSFYRDWYRPELMAVIVVGDIDVDKTVEKIKTQFGKIPVKDNPRLLQSFTVPDNKDIVIAKATDKEATSTKVQIIYKLPNETSKTLNDYRKNLIEWMYTYMINNRFAETVQSSDPPFINGGAYFYQPVRTKRAFVLLADVKKGGIERGMETLVTENQRAKNFGFTQTELERVKKDFLRYIEISFNERDKTESAIFINGFVDNFLSQIPAPGVEFDYDFYKREIPGITLDEINSFASQVAGNINPVVIITAPENEEALIPSDEKIKFTLNDVLSKNITPYESIASEKTLLTAPPVSGSVVDETQTKEVGITMWRLSNGATVILKPTDFKNDEIRFNSFCMGGSSLYSESDFLNAAYCATIIGNSGLGDFNSIELRKFLAGKAAYIEPDIDDLTQGLSGFCSPQDAETMFQMIYLYFTNPNKNKTDFDAFISRMKGYIQNNNANPNTVFYDTVNATMGQYNYRKLPLTEERLDRINFDRVYEIFKERFSDPSGFTFMFVGNFNLETFKPLVEKYIGGIPSANKQESFKDLGIRAPQGTVKKTVYKGVDPKSQVIIMLNGPFEFSRNNSRGMTLLIDLANMKLIEQMREEKSEVYGVGVWGDYSLYPVSTYQINIGWGCAPENVDNLVKTMWSELDKIKSNGCDEKDLRKLKEEALRKFEVNMKDNAFWLNLITGRAYEKKDILDILQYTDYINSVTADDIKRLADLYLKKDNVAEFVLMPENLMGK